MNNAWDDGTFLYHYGIHGQKWGVRRWQNEDGTFNEEGKKRYFGVNAQKRQSINEAVKRYNETFDKRWKSTFDNNGLTRREKDKLYDQYTKQMDAIVEEFIGDWINKYGSLRYDESVLDYSPSYRNSEHGDIRYEIESLIDSYNGEKYSWQETSDGKAWELVKTKLK